MAALEHLNQTQLGDLAAQVNDPDIGGFTVKGVGPDPTAGPPAHSFMAGLGRYGQDNLSMPMDVNDVGEFADLRKDALSHPDHYLGGWSTGGGSRGALDVSKAHTYTGDNKAATYVGAHQSALKDGQEAIGHFGPGEEPGSSEYTGDIDVVRPENQNGNGIARLVQNMARFKQQFPS